MSEHAQEVWRTVADCAHRARAGSRDERAQTKVDKDVLVATYKWDHVDVLLVPILRLESTVWTRETSKA